MEVSKRLAFLLGILMMLLCYGSYLIGRANTEVSHFVGAMVAVQFQEECIKSRDDDCIDKLNKHLAMIVASGLRHSNLLPLDSDSREKISEFISKVKRSNERL